MRARPRPRYARDVIGSRRRLAVLFCLAVLLLAAVLPGGGPPLLAVLTDAPALATAGARSESLEAGGTAPRDRAVAPRSGRAPPPA